MREIRLALLEADVNYAVVKDFVGRVKERAIGEEVMRSLTPGQQVVKIVHDELIATLGEAGRLNLQGDLPHVIMLVGLQGSGKTTTAAKLALHLRREGFKPMMIAGDTYRPAAVDQLMALGKQIDIPVYNEGTDSAPPDIALHGLEQARSEGDSVVIIDTAGRLQIDEDMMAEIEQIRANTAPVEVLLVADAMTGQEAVNIAQGFDEAVGLTGLILTKIDGDARGGAAISMREVTGVPIKYLGTSEKLDGLEVFHPDRLAGRILGMGDVLSLIERAETEMEIDEAEALELERKMREGDFTLEDFQKQLKQVKRLGSLSSVMEMIPGTKDIMSQIEPGQLEAQLKITEAVVNSMTAEERQRPKVLNASRRKRIAMGSGTSVSDVNQLINQWRQMQRAMQQMARGGGLPAMGAGAMGGGGGNRAARRRANRQQRRRR